MTSLNISITQDQLQKQDQSFVYCNWAATSPAKLYGNDDLREIPAEAVRSGRSSDEFTLSLREEISHFFNASRTDVVVFGAGTTDLLNKLILGFLFSKTGKVITTIYDHNSVLRPLHYVRKRQGISMSVLEPGDDGKISEDNLIQSIDSDTLLLVLNHGSNVTGVVQPVEALVRAAHSRGIPVILDCAQTAGVIPIDFQTLGADAIVLSSHKSMMGPTGFGFAIMKKGFPVEPIFSGGSGIRSELELQPEDLPSRLEPGTPNYEGISRFASSLKRYKEKAVQDSLAETKILFGDFIKELDTIEGISIIGKGSSPTLPTVSIVIEGFTAEEAAYILREVFRIISRPGLHCAPLCHRHYGTWPHGAVRLSFGHGNSADDFDHVIASLRTIVSGRSL